MKTLHHTVGGFVVAAGVAALLLIPAVLAEEKQGTVTFEHKGIVVHPGTKISKPDELRLNSVLKKYDKRLYRLETYKNGKLVKKQGELKNRELDHVYIDQAIVSEVASAKATGLSDSTVVFQIGVADRYVPLQNMANGKEMGEQLIKEVKPILKKYTKR